MRYVMRKQTERKEVERIEIIPEYGRQRLLNYAESFRDLADLFEDGQAVQAKDRPAEEEPADRQEYLFKRRLQESQVLLA